MKLQVTTGDITQATTDGIVNSSNHKLDLTVGEFLYLLLQGHINTIFLKFKYKASRIIIILHLIHLDKNIFFFAGAVSQALAKAGGPSLVTECQNIGK